MTFEEKAASLTEHDDFAAYINKVKDEAADLEYRGAVQHELTRTTQFYFDRLMEARDTTEVLLLVGALQGLRLAGNNVEARWPVDKETK